MFNPRKFQKGNFIIEKYIFSKRHCGNLYSCTILSKRSIRLVLHQTQISNFSNTPKSRKNSFGGTFLKFFGFQSNDSDQQNSADLDALISVGKKKIESSRKIVKLALFGNLAITGAKFGVWIYTGSSAMLSEAIHSLVDSGNQGLLLIGLKGADFAADNSHQYGYGKSVYFWSLVSALGTFWFGAGISMWNSVQDIINPSIVLHSIGWETWSVLGFSFLVDGFVLSKTVGKLKRTKPPNITLLKHIQNLRDPTTAAVLMEDGAACIGVTIAVAGIGLSQLSHMLLWDGLAGVGISALLAFMGVYLARLNQTYLLGQAVDPEIAQGIKNILLSRPAFEEVHSVQSQWVGPYAFAYKAEVDFDGTYLAAKLLKRYENEFITGKKLSLDEVKLLLSWYAEDVMRTVEKEVKDAEEHIRSRYPEALYIELEPDSKKTNTSSTSSSSYAVDDGKEDSLRKIEIETINQLQSAIQRERLEEMSKLGDAAWEHAGDDELAVDSEVISK
eukprot:gene7353-15010_t